jgi:hypothetical protein
MPSFNPSSFLQKFQDYIANQFDFGIYRPFYHGTTKERAKIIMKEGLLRRIDAPSRSEVTSNKWESEVIESLPDRVYFITCIERSGIAREACLKALPFEHRSPDQCLFIELIDYQKYQSKFIIDEDSKEIPFTFKRFFSDNSYKSYKVNVAMHLFNRDISKFYEIGFVIGGGDLVSKMIDLTPSALFSICDWGTFAIKSSISQEDLKLVPLEVYLKRENCRERTGYFDIDRDLYSEFENNHDEEHAIMFKKALATKYKIRVF